MKIFKAIFVIFALLALGGCAVQNQPSGSNLKSKKNRFYKKSHLCANKTPKECNDIGVKFELGEEPEKAEICYKRACEKDIGVACSNLGSLYINQSELKPEDVDVAGLFMKSCDLNNAYGCYNAANLYRLGQGVEYDFELAIKLYTKACGELKDAKSCTNLGSMHHFSLGVKSDQNSAKKFYQMGCEMGDKVGCKNLSFLTE